MLGIQFAKNIHLSPDQDQGVVKVVSGLSSVLYTMLDDFTLELAYNTNFSVTYHLVQLVNMQIITEEDSYCHVTSISDALFVFFNFKYLSMNRFSIALILSLATC